MNLLNFNHLLDFRYLLCDLPRVSRTRDWGLHCSFLPLWRYRGRLSSQESRARPSSASGINHFLLDLQRVEVGTILPDSAPMRPDCISQVGGQGCKERSRGTAAAHGGLYEGVI